jgi:hypothetical protein
MSNPRHNYHLTIEDDAHWALTKLGAEIRMDYETYAEKVLEAHAEQNIPLQRESLSLPEEHD